MNNQQSQAPQNPTIMSVVDRGKELIGIDMDVFKSLCNFTDRDHMKVYKKAVREGRISISELKRHFLESIPICFFLLDKENIKKKLTAVEDNRLDKLRRDVRVIYRNPKIVENIEKIVNVISRKHFFDINELYADSTFSPSRILDGIKKIPRKNIPDFKKKLQDLFEENGIIVYFGSNASDRMLIEVDKSFDGFCIYDNKAPAIFINGAVSAGGRQIFSMIYFLFEIMRNSTSVMVDFDTQKPKNIDDSFKQSSDILLPQEETNGLAVENITIDFVGVLAKRYCVTPTMVLYTLYFRGVISRNDLERLKSLIQPEQKQKKGRNSLKAIVGRVINFNSRKSTKLILGKLSSNQITRNQASYRLFRRPVKKGDDRLLRSIKNNL